VKLSETSVRRPVTVLMVVFIVLILGFVSFTKIPLDLMPEMDIPVAVVSTNYTGVGPQEIEKLITKPIEQSAATIQNLDKISSISSEGNSLVIIQFNYGTNMDNAALDIREKVDLVKGRLPDDASAPMVIKIDPNMQAILTFSLSSDTLSLTELKKMAEDVIQPRMERTEGVASVTISGGASDIVEIRTKSEKLLGYGISLEYLANILRSENVNLPGGTVKKGSWELSVKTTGEFGSVQEIEQMLIPLPTGSTVQLKDLADIELKPDQQTTISKTNGNPGVSIAVQKQSASNTVKVSEAAQAEMQSIQNELRGVKLDVVRDNAVYIKRSLNQVGSHGMAGALLAVFILYIFLRNVRSTLIIASSIPISIIATFCLLYFSSITINMMTLSGLMLGIGRLVDDSVVVLENIYRFRQNGYSRVEAAVKGSSEVIIAVMASTLTTVAVFLPIVFVQGLTSTLFRQFALTIAFSLGASLVVAMTLVPMLSSVLLKVDRRKPPVNGFSSLLEAEGGIVDVNDNPQELFRPLKIIDTLLGKFDLGYQKLTETYKKLLVWALGHRKKVIVITTIVMFVSMASVAVVGTEFFPTTDEGLISISVTLPDGAKVEDTAAIMGEIEKKIAGIPEIDTVFMDAGSSGQMGFSGAKGNRGSFSVKLADLSKRKRGVTEISDQMRDLTKDIPGARIGITVAQSMTMGGTSSPVSITVKGDDLEALKKIGDDFVGIVKKVPGTREVKSSYEDGIPEVEVKIDRKTAVQYGLTAGQIANAIKASISGTTATQYKYEGTEIDVKIKGDESYNQNMQALEQIPVSTGQGFAVTLGQVANIAVNRGPVSINRDNQVRTISVTSELSGRDVGSVSKDIQAQLDQYTMPDKYYYEVGGQQKEMVKAFSDLFLALGLAVVLVYMVMASQFESLVHPLVIMFSMPLGFAGAFLGLFITGKPLSVMSIIGLIMLVGIVVSNAIVLVDYINTRRKVYNEDPRTAIINAGPIRLRPIIMTTLTTVLAMLPLSLGIGEGSELQSPMGIVVISGLTFSTLVTLVIIPVMYTLFDEFGNKVKKFLHIAPKPVSSVASAPVPKDSHSM